LAHQEELKAKSRAYTQAHAEDHKARARAYVQALFSKALRVLGAKCACPGCDVSERAFLTIDHIYGQPSRKPSGQRKNALLEARITGWDKTKFQILCANCNFAKRDRGFCPVHQKASDKRNGHSPELANPQLLLWPC
jgi:hypothetical protein